MYETAKYTRAFVESNGAKETARAGAYKKSIKNAHAASTKKYSQISTLRAKTSLILWIRLNILNF